MVRNLIVKPVLAQNPQPLGDISGIGPLGLEGGGDPAGILNTIVSNLLGFLTICGGIWFIIQLILAGYNFISSQGDAQKIKDAQRQITNAFIGIAVVVSAIFLLSLIGELLGVEFLNIVEQINNLTP
ncbi:MAG: hypothetical protein ABH867_00110 [Patescibacteria group bacterium]|nr:hypothetical protein [Patescibacteria group bacterium]